MFGRRGSGPRPIGSLPLARKATAEVDDEGDLVQEKPLPVGMATKWAVRCQESHLRRTGERGRRRAAHGGHSDPFRNRSQL